MHEVYGTNKNSNNAITYPHSQESKEKKGYHGNY